MKQNFVFVILAIGFTIAVNSMEKALAQERIPASGLPDGFMIIEGDILVPIDFYKNRIQGTWRQNKFWPSGIVPFQFHANVTQANQNAMLAAMAEWERAASVDFVRRNNEDDWVEILDADVNSSHVGREDGRQVINIFNWENRWIMCHELAHCLGYWHEQSRPDRDSFVQINPENIEDDEEDNFERHDDAGQYGPYDYDSIMHYGQFDFCINPCPGPTITVLPPNDTWQSRIGQRTHLSQLDTLTMSFLYAQPNWRFVDAAFTGSNSNGTFFLPHRNFDPNVASSVIPAGSVVWLQPGSYVSAGRYDKAMILQAPLGNVVLGK